MTKRISASKMRDPGHPVAAHGGTLSIESKPGEGTQVRVALPAGPSVSTPSA